MPERWSEGRRNAIPSNRLGNFGATQSVMTDMETTVCIVGARPAGAPPEADATPLKYSFNPKLLDRIVQDRPCVALVATATTSPDLLWNPAERLFFAQDLMFMIRAFWLERPDMFLDEMVLTERP